MKCIKHKCTYCIPFRTGMGGFYCGIGAFHEDNCNISRQIKNETRRWKGRIASLTNAEKIIKEHNNEDNKS